MGIEEFIVSGHTRNTLCYDLDTELLQSELFRIEHLRHRAVVLARQYKIEPQPGRGGRSTFPGACSAK